jgi:demethylsterigmatocystin 6-O-methyltransferase
MLTPTDCSNSPYRFDNMAPIFVHLPSYFASNGFNEPSNQETGPYADVFDRTYWQRVNGTPKLKDDFHTYMAAHKKGCSSIVDLLPISSLVEGYDKSSPVLLVDIGGGVGHQSRELRSRYPHLEGDIVVQDLRVSKELELAGVRGMEYDFFTPQPIKSRFPTTLNTSGLV